MASERENGTVNFNAKNKWKSSRKLVKKNDLNDQVKEKTLKILDKWKAFCADRRKEKGRAEARRKGPAPIEDYSLSNLSCKRNKVSKPTYGTLDSDVEDLDIEGGLSRRKCKVKCPGKKLDQGDRSLASCKALIIYFANVAKSKDDDEKLDLKFVSSLLQNGADINFGDRHGQTMIHEVARGWHTDVMKFAILHGADLNKADHFGRTPLHLASAMNYAEMVEFLIQNEGEHFC